MSSIAPPGNDISKWPKALPSTNQIAVVEAAKNVTTQAGSSTKTMQLINSSIARYSQFFTAHFGLQPTQQMYNTYFKNKNVTQGAGTLAIAQEIMAFKDPAPEDYGLTREVLIGIIVAMSRIESLEGGKQAAKAEADALLEPAVFTLDVRPTAEAYIAYQETQSTKNLSSILKNKTGASVGAVWNGFTKTEVRDPKNNKFIRYEFSKQHPDGYKIHGDRILYYYYQAYSKTPKYFWEFSSRHRIRYHIDPKDKSKVDIVVVSVDPATGAQSQSGFYRVATSTNQNDLSNPGFFLARVKEKLFPELFLLTDGIVLSTDERKSAYLDQLNTAVNMWTGIPDKAQTPITVTLSQEYTFNPTDGVQNSPNNKTTVPYNYLQINLQPTGIEEAMRRILDINHPSGNAVLKWLAYVNNSSAGTHPTSNNFIVQPNEGEYQYKVITSQSSWNWFTTVTMPNTIACLVQVLGHPYLYQNGLAQVKNIAKSSPQIQSFLAGSARDLPNANLYLQYYLANAFKIMELAGWPEGPPQQMFKAPFDDQADISMLVGMFNGHMNEKSTIAPPMMAISEPVQMAIAHKMKMVAQTGGQANYEILFSLKKGSAYAGKKPDKVYFYTPHSTDQRAGQALNMMLYTKNSKTVVTRTSVADRTMTNLPVQIEPKRISRGFTATGELSDISGGAIVATSGMVIGGLLVGTWALSKWANQRG